MFPVFPVFPKILKNSACEVHSEVLTCVCISQGLPLPTIKMPLLETHTAYSVITTTVSNHTVNISVSVPVKDRNYTTVTCISSSVVGEAKENLMIIINELKQDGKCGQLKYLIYTRPLLYDTLNTSFLEMSLWC